VSTAQQYLVTANVGGRDLGVFDTMKGGETTVKAAMHRPGGMGPEKSYLTLPTYSAITLTRVAERDRDWELVRWLQDQAGKVRVQVTRQPLDEQGNAWGTPQTWAGRLGSVKPGDTDSTSSNPLMWEMTVNVETRS
jgi:hypothetical protein